MGLDPRFVIASDLESIFVDKTTGLPLSAGIVTSFSDINRSQMKPIYQLTGSPPNYTYSPLVNPVILSNAGTFQDEDGNNIVPYYFVYQGTPDHSNGTVENYYITVTDSGLNAEFTREGWPNFTAEDTMVGNFVNFIPNGQFITHNDIPATNATPDGQPTLSTTDLAQGGWTFELPNSFGGKYNISFYRFPISVAGVQDFPRYGVQYICTQVNGDSFQTLRIKFKNVNMFASPDLDIPQTYTFFCNAESRDGNSYTVNVLVNKFFGAGGSPTTQTNVGSFEVTPSFGSGKTFTFNFSNNTGMTLGAGDDDYVSLDIVMPNTTCNVLLTDFVLAFGNITITGFPIQTEAESLAESIAGWIDTPTPDGADFYLPVVMTPTGMKADHGEIGNLVGKTTLADFSGSISTVSNELLADGTQYQTSLHSPLGIPYARLQAKYFNNTYNFPIYGTGGDWVTSYISLTNSSLFRIQTNSATAPLTATADGSTMTGFTFATVKFSLVLPNQLAYQYSSTALLFQLNTIGAVTSPTAGTTSFSISTFVNNSLSYPSWLITCTAATGMGGQYFTFNDASTAYYMWFTVDGSGSDPAPGGYTSAGVINMLSTWSAAEVTQVVREALCGLQSSSVLVTGVPPAGSWFSFYNPDEVQNIIWFKVAGMGTLPIVSGATIIEIDLAGTETTTQIAALIQLVINSRFFAVPDFQGLFPRGYDPTKEWDTNVDNRFSLLSGYWGDQLATLEESTNIGHLHSFSGSVTGTTSSPYFTADGTGTPSVTIGTPSEPGTYKNTLSGTATGNTGLQGSGEARPVNFNVAWAIKY